jgi:hypothetical protein
MSLRSTRAALDEQVMIAGNAFTQNLPRRHHEVGIEAPPAKRVRGCVHGLALGDLNRGQYY